MKILLLCNKLPYPTNDGSSIAIARMIEGYVQAGAELTVLSLNTKKHYKHPDSIPETVSKNVRFEIVDVDTNPTVGNAFANLFQKLPFHVSRFFLKEVSQKLTHLLKQQAFDLVQCEGLFMMPYQHLVRQHSEAKVVLRAHNIEHQIWDRAIQSTTKPVLKAFLRSQASKLKRYEIYCAKHADAVIPISPVDAEFFKEYNSNVHTVACGVTDVKPIKKIAKDQCFHLGAMDWLPNQLGIDWLLKSVWPKVFAKNNKLTLHLAGRAMTQELKQTKAPGVVVHGEVESASDFRAQHGIMLVPLQAGSGMRIKIVEGLAEGIPIISTALGAEGIEAANGKHLLIADEAEDFANAILQLTGDDKLLETIGKNAATLATEKYLNQTLIAELVGFYRNTWQIS